MPITVVTEDPQNRGSVSPLCKESRGAASLSVRSRPAPNPSDPGRVGSEGGTKPIGAMRMAGNCLEMRLDGTWLLRARAHALDAL